MEILATIPVYTYPWIYKLLFAVAVLFVIGGIIFCLMAFEKDGCIPALVGLAFIIAGFFVMRYATNAMEKTSFLDYNKYKVTIDETVNARELLDKYEILSREGEIFTIKEIEVDE